MMNNGPKSRNDHAAAGHITVQMATGTSIITADMINSFLMKYNLISTRLSEYKSFSDLKLSVGKDDDYFEIIVKLNCPFTYH